MNSKFAVKTILLHSLLVNLEAITMQPFGLDQSSLLFFFVFLSTHMEKKKCHTKTHEQYVALSVTLHLWNTLSSFHLNIL